MQERLISGEAIVAEADITYQRGSSGLLSTIQLGATPTDAMHCISTLSYHAAVMGQRG